MKKLLSLLLAMVLLFLLTACEGKPVQDGTYRVEYDTFDAIGYKDFVEVTFKDGTVTEVTMDAVDENGALKSASADYRESMENIAGTYPAKYYQDLINQYIQSGSSEGVAIVAGATSTSNNIVTLLIELEKALRSGSTETLIIVPRA